MKSKRFVVGGLGITTGTTLLLFFAGNPIIATTFIPWHCVPEMMASFFCGTLCRRLRLRTIEFACLLAAGGVLTVLGVLVYLGMLTLPGVEVESLFVIFVSSPTIIGWQLR